MRRVIGYAAFCWCLCFGIRANWADDAIRGEAWTDPSRFEFEGLTLVPAKKLTQALVGDPPMILASCRPPSRTEFLRLVASRVLEGYQSSGFPDARVSAEFDEARQRVVVRVNEGPRFVWGEVRISGNREISSAELIPWLTEKHARGKRAAAVIATQSDDSSQTDMARPPMRDWNLSEAVKIKQPARFSGSSLIWLNASIQRGCENQGHFAAKFHTDIERDLSTHVAHLRIVFDDEGSPAVLHDVEFVGLTRHTPDEVMAELQLKRDHSAKGLDPSDLERQLADSGRFVTQRVTLQHTEAAPSELCLKIEVAEYEVAPKLTEPLSRRAETLRRFAHWVEQFPNQPQDLLCRWTYRTDPPAVNAPPNPISDLKGMSGVLVLSPRRGLLVSVDVTKTNAGQVPFLTGLLANDRTALWLPSAQSRLDIVADKDRPEAFSSLRSMLQITFAGVNRPGQKGQGNCSLGYGVSNRRRPDQSPLEVKLTFPVVTALNALDRPEWKESWQDGVLVLTQEGARMRIDEETGQLLDARIGTEDDRILSVRMGEGLFDQEFARYDRASRDVPNAFDRNARCESSARFLISAAVTAIKSVQNVVPGGVGVPILEDDIAERVQAFVNNPRWMALATQFATVLFEDPLPDFLAADNGQAYFWIPQEYSLQQKHPQEAWAPLTMIVTDELVGRDSWAWKTGRLSALALFGKAAAAEEDFRYLLSMPRLGPLAWWANSCALGWVAPNWQKLAAEVGQRRLNRGLFQRDVEGLLQQGGRLQRASEQFARQLRSLSDEELANAIGSLFEEKLAISLFRQWRRWIRDEEFADADLLPMLLGSLWQPLFQEPLTESLIARQNLGGMSLTGEMLRYLDQVEGKSTNQTTTPPKNAESKDLLRLRLNPGTQRSLLFPFQETETNANKSNGVGVPPAP